MRPARSVPPISTAGLVLGLAATLVMLGAGCSSSTGGVASGTTSSAPAATDAPPDMGDAPVSSGTNPRTRQRADGATTLVPDPSTGVLTGNAVGAMACPEGRACPDMAVILAGTVRADSASGSGTTPVEATIDSTGAWGMRLAPGEYTVTVEATDGSCEPTTATAVAGSVTNVPLRCTGT